jgi:hypothetical protein
MLKGAAVATVVPMALVSVTPTPFVGSFTGKFMSVKIGGRTYHYVKGIADAALKHKINMETALLYGDMKMCIPNKTGTLEYIDI